MRREPFWVCAVAAFAVLAVPVQMVVGAGGIGGGGGDTGLEGKEVRQAYAALPLAFEANRGQVDPGPGFVARGSGYAFLIGATGATLEFTPGGLHAAPGPDTAADPPPVDVVRIALIGADPGAAATTGSPDGTTGSFLGTDPGRWRAAVPDYSRVVYHSIYPGIDLAFHGLQGSLEYDFLVAPGADSRAIRVRLDGAPAVAASGEVALAVPGGTVLQHPATIYQPPAVAAAPSPAAAAHPARSHAATPRHHPGRAPAPVPVGGGFSLGRGGALHLDLGAYDHSRRLVVDPVVTWSPALGGGVDDTFVSAAGPQGDAYLVTGTPSPGAAGGGPALTDLAVLRLDRAGRVVYRTFLSGDGDANVSDVTVDRGGGLAITGEVSSPSTGPALVAQGGAPHLTVRLGPNGLPLPLPRTGAAPGS
jgi:hypothetical protein